MKLTEHNASTPEKIMETTFQLLAARGYAYVSMRDIAQAAGVSLGQITYHFGSKEKLILLVVGKVTDRCVDELAGRLQCARTHVEKMETVTDYFLSLRGDRAQLFRVLLDFIGQAIWVPAFRSLLSDFFGRMSALVAQDEDIEEDDPAQMPGLVLGSMIGSTVQAALGLSPDGQSPAFTDDPLSATGLA